MKTGKFTKTKHPGSKKGFKPREDNLEKTRECSVHENDWQWYAANEQLLKDAASLQFSNALGLPVGYKATDYIGGVVDDMPGIMLISMMPTVGHSEDPSSAVNVGAKNINSWVRHANSGSRNYESSDLMMGILATSSVFDYIAMLERLYGLARVYSQQNRYLAKSLLECQVGSSIADSILENLADFRYYINQAIIKASTLKIPKGLTYVDRHMWLNSHVWKDDTSAKAQIYVPLLMWFYKYVPTKFATGGSLEYITFSTVGTYSTLFVTLNQMLDALIRDDDINTMWGDIIKAYGDDGCYKLVSLPEDYAVVAEYSEEVLMQFENLTFIDKPSVYSGDDAIAQYNNYLISVPEVYFPNLDPTNTGRYGPAEIVDNLGDNVAILNIAHDNPTVADNMVATRLSVGFTDKQINTGLTATEIGTLAGSPFYECSFGTELVCDLTVATEPDINSGGMFPIAPTFKGRATSGITPNTYISDLLTQHVISKFKYHPQTYHYVIDDGQSPAVWYFQGYLGAADNYTVIQFENYRKLNDTALLNEFAVPQLGIVKK